MRHDECFIEVDWFQNPKHGQAAAGDVFSSHKASAEGRTVCVLADGLGSGIKARVLATMTATMAMKYALSDIDIRRASEIILATLPVCSERKIGYSTFTIMDVRHDGVVRIIEHDNPPYLLVREQEVVEIDKDHSPINTPGLGVRQLYYSRFDASPGDRIVVFSDGVTQSGMGQPNTPLGWSQVGAREFVAKAIQAEPDISARRLSRLLVQRALENDHRLARDDISCAVVYYRMPRKLLVMTGPPINKNQDSEMAQRVKQYDGRKVVCGGTTASIIARELNRQVTIDLANIDPKVPPPSHMKGVDLITEGTITLSRLAELLESGTDPETNRPDAAVQLLRYFLDSDIVEFVVGTKINDAHQDPNLPVELDIRRNLIKRLVSLLNEKYLKEASVEFI